MAKINKADLILDAVEKLIGEIPVTDISLEKIAVRASISKGGVLYHFKTRESILQALVLRLISRFEEQFEKFYRGCGYTEACYKSHTHPSVVSSAKTLIAVTSYDPSLLNPLREAYVRWDSDILSHFADPVDAWKLRLIFDGLFFCHLLDLPLPSREQRLDILESFKQTSIRIKKPKKTKNKK